MRRRVGLDAAFAAEPLSRMATQPKRIMREALRQLAQDPTGRATGLGVRELDLSAELPKLYRLRVGSWRAVFTVRDREVVVARIFHRSEGYGWLERLDAPLGTVEEK